MKCYLGKVNRPCFSNLSGLKEQYFRWRPTYCTIYNYYNKAVSVTSYLNKLSLQKPKMLMTK